MTDFEEENHLLVAAIYLLPSWARRKKGLFGALPLSSRKPLTSKTMKGYVISIKLYYQTRKTHTPLEVCSVFSTYSYIISPCERSCHSNV